MFPADVELAVDWHLTNRCNFGCDYCHPQIKYVLNTRDLDEPEPAAVARAFDGLGLRCGILMSGGEPFSFPGFVDLCRRLTQRHQIAINTNLSNSAEIERFCEEVEPSKVARILAATHVVERERLGVSIDNFAANFRTLRAAGFPVQAAYVLHPEVLPRAEMDFALLRSSGVADLVGKVFKGVWDGRRFPAGYNYEERIVVDRLIEGYAIGPAYLEKRWNFTGLLCSSGVQSVKIDIRGNVQRCVSSPLPKLGNLFDGTFVPSAHPAPCAVRQVLVLSECASLLIEPPSELQELLE